MFVGLEMRGQSLCKVQTNSQLGVLLSWGKKQSFWQNRTEQTARNADLAP